MKVYLVGGAVRDQLLNIPVQEKDWVVVGATPNQLIQKNFKQVGKEFPVFLHPNTKEEYALARTERKTSPGYYGFSCDFSPKVTLEEDLGRRDLTINAMAQDEKGQIIDPYNGQADLKNKVLRHVSPAFIEDPVRVLRVARFAARFYHLGFTLANETRMMMYEMVQQGELDHLVPERVWQEWQKSLEEKNPEQFIMTLRYCDALRVILPELNVLFGVPNPKLYHHEIDSGIHSLLVLESVVHLSSDPIIRFSALLHDLGKALTPMNKWPSHYGHEEAGVAVIEALCHRLRIPSDYMKLASLVSRYHLIIHRLNELKASTIVKILEHTDAFRRPQVFDNLLIACQADAEGRLKPVNYIQRTLWQKLRDECAALNPQDIIAEGFVGSDIKQKMHERRIACVEQLLKSWNLNEK